MTERAHKSLSGHWTGVYDYDNAPEGFEAAPFNALLVESGCALSGEIVEPNTFSPDPQVELFASLAGGREGAEVSFIKTYERATHAGHSVIYEGVVNGALTRIEGRWRIGGFWGGEGPFVMDRADAGEALEIEATAEAGAK